jgi:hypothetical protein
MFSVCESRRMNRLEISRWARWRGPRSGKRRAINGKVSKFSHARHPDAEFVAGLHCAFDP